MQAVISKRKWLATIHWKLQIGAIEGQVAKHDKLIPLSEQNLIDCASPDNKDGCEGGTTKEAFDYVKNNGIVIEEDYPYIASAESCHVDSSKIVTKLSAYVNIPSGDEESLLTALAIFGPISVSFDATSELQNYKGGILRDTSCQSQDLNHAGLLVGYGNEDGKEFYIVKNSWGDSWGERGYFRLEKISNQCGIASEASYPILWDYFLYRSVV